MSKIEIVKGQAYLETIDGVTSLIQINTIFPDTGDSYNTTNVIVSNIWDDLMLATGHLYKKEDGKNYFYWEYTETNLSDSSYITAKFDCPKPKFWDVDWMTNVYLTDTTSDWANYWKAKTDEDNKKLFIQKETVKLGATDRVNYVSSDGSASMMAV